MIIDWFLSNFITLMVIVVMIVLMIVNQKLRIPATQLLYVLLALLFILTILDYADDFLAGRLNRPPMFDPTNMRTTVDVLRYIIRPLIILIELMVILPQRRYRLICAVPAVINAAVYSTALFGSRLAFYIDGYTWHGGALGFCVYAVQLVYVIALAVYSLYYFGRGNRIRGIIIFVIVLIAAATAVLEYKNLMNDRTTEVAAICVLIYYIYLASIHQQEMYETIEEKKLHIAQQELLLLRSQIDAVFISKVLATIRSLAKTDKRASASAIDSFSTYLRSHLNALRDETPISFAWELDSVKAYLSLLKLDGGGHIEMNTDLQITEFDLPPLTLESSAEYCISRERGDEQTLTIRTAEDDSGVSIYVSASCVGSHSTETDTGRSGLENVRRRVEAQYGGTVSANDGTDGTSVSIVIPHVNVSE